MEKLTFSETLALASTFYFYVYLSKGYETNSAREVEFQVRKWYVVLPKLNVFEILLHFSNIWIRIKRFLIRLTCFQKSPALWQKKRSEIGLLDSSIHQTPVQSPPCQTAWAATRAARSWLTEPAWSLSTWLFGDSCEASATNLWHYHSTYDGFLKHGSWSIGGTGSGGTGSFPPCELWTEFREVHLRNQTQFLMTVSPMHQGLQRWFKSSIHFRIDRL